MKALATQSVMMPLLMLHDERGVVVVDDDVVECVTVLEIASLTVPVQLQSEVTVMWCAEVAMGRLSMP